MKKLILVLGLFAIVACRSEKYTTMTFNEKVALAEQSIGGDEKATKEIETTREKITKAISKGDEKAKDEDLDWALALKAAELKTSGQELTDDIKEKLAQAVEDAKDKVNETKEAVETKVEETKENASEKVEEVKDKVQEMKDTVSEAKDNITEKATSLGDAVKEATTDVKNVVKDTVEEVKKTTK